MFRGFRNGSRFARAFSRMNGNQKRFFTAMLTDHHSRLSVSDQFTWWGVMGFFWGGLCLFQLSHMLLYVYPNIDVDDEFYELWKILRNPVSRAQYERNLTNQVKYKEYLKEAESLDVQQGNAARVTPLLGDTKERISKASSEIESAKTHLRNHGTNAELDILRAANVSQELLDRAYLHGNTLTDREIEDLRNGVRAVLVSRVRGLNDGKSAVRTDIPNYLSVSKNFVLNLVEATRTEEERKITKVACDLGERLDRVVEFESQLGGLEKAVNAAVSKDKERNKFIAGFASPLLDPTKEAEIAAYWRGLLRKWQTTTPPVIVLNKTGEKEYVVAQDAYDKQNAADAFIRQYLAGKIEHPDLAIAAHVLSEGRIDPAQLRQQQNLFAPLANTLRKKVPENYNVQFDSIAVDEY